MLVRHDFSNRLISNGIDLTLTMEAEIILVDSLNITFERCVSSPSMFCTNIKSM